MASSKLQEEIRQFLADKIGHFAFKENYHPDWLIAESGRRLELDFYIEDYKLAIEVQGEQHYIFVPHFHKSEESFERQQKRDTLKRIACSEAGIILLEVVSLSAIIDWFELLEDRKRFPENTETYRNKFVDEACKGYDKAIVYLEYRLKRLESRIEQKIAAAKNKYEMLQIEKTRREYKKLDRRLGRVRESRQDAAYSAVIWFAENWQGCKA